MLNLGTLSTRLIADYSALEKGEKAAQKFADKVEQQFARAENASKRLKKAGKIASVAITTPLLAGAHLMTNMASDYRETANKVDAIFGKSGASLKNWSKQSAEAFGLSRTAALDYASRFGGSLKTIGGISQEESAKVSTALVGLTSDLNSFFNQENAGSAIASALTGEYEALKKFNIIINESTLKQELMNQKLYSGKGALTQQQKLLGTLAIIQKQSSDAQGDFARTSNELANSQRILKAQFENASSELGSNLLPLKLKLVQLLSTLLSNFNALSPQVKRFLLILAGAAALIGPILILTGVVIGLGASAGIAGTTVRFLGTSILWVAKTVIAILSPIAILVGALAAVGVAIIALAGGFDNVRIWNKDLSITENISRLLQVAWVGLKVAAYALLAGLSQLITWLLSLGRHGEDVAVRIGRGFTHMGNAIKTVINFVMKGINFMISEAIGGINFLIKAVNKIPKVDIGEIDAEKYKINPLEMTAIGEFKAAGVGSAEAFMKGLTAEFAQKAADGIGEIEKILNADPPKVDVKTADAEQKIKDLKMPVLDLKKGIADINVADLSDGLDKGAASADKVKGSVGGIGAGIDSANQKLEEMKSKFDQLQGSVLSGMVDHSIETNNSDTYAAKLEQEQAAYTESLNQLKEAERLKLDSVKPYHILREEMERQHQEKLKNIQRERLDSQLNAAQTFFGDLSGLQELESKKAQRIGKAAAIAEATINMYRAAVSAYAFGSKFGGPVVGAAFAGAAIAANAASIAKIKASKATGGNVFGGGAYRVNENSPEMLSTGKGDFLMMGSGNGKVVPMNKVGGGSSPANTVVQVEINNYANAEVEVRETDTDEGRKLEVIINRTKQEIAGEILNGSGDVANSLDQKYKRKIG